VFGFRRNKKNNEQEHREELFEAVESEMKEEDKGEVSLFDDDIYSDEPVKQEDISVEDKEEEEDKGINVREIKSMIEPFARRGTSIAITGCGGCGTSTVAFHLANTISNMGYSVLLVDMDLDGRTQSYISKQNFDSVDIHGCNLLDAIKENVNADAFISGVKHNFRLLTMGLGADPLDIESLLDTKKLRLFINAIRASHNFIIFDIPFKYASTRMIEVVYTADNLVIVVDSSNWGVVKTMTTLGKVRPYDLMDTIFSRGQLLFNRYRGFDKIMGRKIRNPKDVCRTMDALLQDIQGEVSGYYFEGMPICGIIEEKDEFERGWFDGKQFSDTKEGSKLFMNILKNIVLREEIK
jgi:cellulose biosynthesis protein BcsQ